MDKRIVAIYARVSTEHEAQISALDNQVQYYDEILAKHPNWQLFDRYIDEGITGTSVKKRKNFVRMMEDANEGKFDLIITREVSRFARNTLDTLQETRKLKRIGVEVWFTEDNIWTLNDEDGELRLTIMATLAQNESKKISQRVKAGQKISFLNAVPYGSGNILGYDRVGSEMKINNEQAETVRLIFKRYLQGKGTRLIANELEQLGRTTSTGCTKWHSAYIAKLLDNPFYCGTIVYRKSYIPDYLEQKAAKNYGEVEQIVVEGKHEPLISKQDFQRVQEIKKSRSFIAKDNNVHGFRNGESIWTKKVVCSCGSRMLRLKWYKSKTTKVVSYGFQCAKAKRMGSVAYRKKRGLDTEGMCECPLFPEWKLNLMAGMIFRFFWNDKKRVLEIANGILEECIKQGKIDEDQEELAVLERKVKSIARKKNSLLDMRLAEEIEPAVYKEKLKELDEELEKLNKNIENLRPVRLSDSDDSIEKRISLLKYTLEQNFNINTFDIPNDILDAFIDKVVVEKDRFKFYLNLRDKENGVIDTLIPGERRKKPDLNDYSYIVNPINSNGSTGCYSRKVEQSLE